jgi:hypothetical protein
MNSKDLKSDKVSQIDNRDKSLQQNPFKRGNAMKNAFICSICEGFIFDGESMWAVSVQHEVSENWVITVLDAKPAYVFCEECAKQRDFDNILIPIKNERNEKCKIKMKY